MGFPELGNNLRKDLNGKSAQINAELQVSELEKDHHAHKKHQEKRIKELENTLKQKKRKEKDEVPIPDDSSIQCNKCEYKTTSRQGLKIHNAKVH